ncbi:MAG: phosphotransferase [Tistlia sp.]|uniref:phosphotransferase n=1 Tax=Tistlia sp. TaxID=3057121 RepID=UPI0034A0D7B6
MNEADARALIAAGLGEAAGRDARLGAVRRGAVAEVRFFEWRGRPLLLRRRRAGAAFGYEPGLAKEPAVAAAWAARGAAAGAVGAGQAAAQGRPAPGRLPHGPALLASGHGARPWSIQEAVAGPALGAAPRPEAYRRLGAQLAELHALPLPGFAATFHDLARPAEPARLFAEDLECALEAAARAAALPASLAARLRRLARADLARADFAGARPALCHNDLHGLNVLAGRGGEPVLIDWDNAVLRPAELDLVKLRHWTALDGAGVLAAAPALYEAFRDGYETAGRAEGSGPPDPDRLRACELLWLLRVLAFEAGREAAGRAPAAPFPAAAAYRARLEELAERGEERA